MIKIDHKKAQAAAELAVFGAILIFLIGTIVRIAVGNSYTQDYNFKAMRMAMLASWQGSMAAKGKGAAANTSHNSASILFVEDRLTPDNGKYGDLDRNPFIAQGSGTFSYELLYPWEPGKDKTVDLIPVMDVYINGQHFPFTTASYVTDQRIVRPVCSPDGGPYTSYPLSPAQCQQNQCLRNRREWAGGIIKASLFIKPPLATVTQIDQNCLSQLPGAAQNNCQNQNNACTIFTKLVNDHVIISSDVTPPCTDLTSGSINPEDSLNGQPIIDSVPWSIFASDYKNSFPDSPGVQNKYLQAILKVLQGVGHPYKLFYSQVVNGTPYFNVYPPTCTSHPCKDKELSSDAPLVDSQGSQINDASGNALTNKNGDMEYDLLRNADYAGDASAVETLLPPEGCGFTPIIPPATPPTPAASTQCLRQYMAWQWSATAGTDANMIGLNVDNNQYPQYDIDGRLKAVTIYGIRQDSSGTTHLDYEDPQGGDIDSGWDYNSCGPKPGLQTSSQIFTFTQDGTYLQINEGKLYNPETGQEVRSASKRNTIDLIQRTIRLSNNTGRFCGQDGNPLLTVANDGVTPNPVEVCVNENSTTGNNNCFTPTTFPQTCYDTTENVIFVRSRLQDLRGHFWMTNASGQLKVQ